MKVAVQAALGAELAAELRERLTHSRRMTWSSRWKPCATSSWPTPLARRAASEIAGSLPLMKISDYLTWLAEAILEQVLAWPGARPSRATARRNGWTAPVAVWVHHCRLWESRRYRTWAWFGPGPGVYPRRRPAGETDGAKPIDGAQFFTRLGQLDHPPADHPDQLRPTMK